jgi:hypothetical protein
LQQLLATARPLAWYPFGHDVVEHRLTLITTSADFARKLASEGDRVRQLDDRSAGRLREALKPQQASLEALRAAMRGERDGATLHPIVDRLAGIDRDLTEAGAGRADTRRTMLGTLGSLDATLVELGENLGLAPTEDVPSEPTLSAKHSESQERTRAKSSQVRPARRRRRPESGLGQRTPATHPLSPPRSPTTPMLHQNREHSAAPSRSPGGQRPALNQTDYDRAMGRLRVCMRVLSAVLLALIARSVVDGANLAVVLTAALIALLLLASGALWLYGRRLEPHASASRTATPNDRHEKRIAVTDRHESSRTRPLLRSQP